MFDLQQFEFYLARRVYLKNRNAVLGDSILLKKRYLDFSKIQHNLWFIRFFLNFTHITCEEAR